MFSSAQSGVGFASQYKIYPVTQKLADTVQTVQVLKNEGEEKEKRIHALEGEVVQLKPAVDNHEQHGPSDSIRILGLSKQTPGSTHEKVFRLCNERMRIQLPLSLEEISVSHQVGKPKEPIHGNPAPPRPLLVKFVTRLSKNRVMGAKKELRKCPGDPNGWPRHSIYYIHTTHSSRILTN